ncbi:DUF2849 domain-containing protein [Marimonas arenosa]|uniref:DUF2849 domain-containing protein n=1 Tax=Marimonas arenosa TaxID=1795305 RepID=A0AAE4B1T4_9RHOB|nr:DUF2849 domain-containing protein [Marimonas arenosa]MDQ2088383.1 DUF2849 domain-containing protein [Marimonas arenosa]
MSTDISPKVVTATARSSGNRVYLTGCDEWSPEILHAEFIDDDKHADFRLFVASKQTRLVDAPRLTPIEITENGPVPVLASDLAAE